MLDTIQIYTNCANMQIIFPLFPHELLESETKKMFCERYVKKCCLVTVQIETASTLYWYSIFFSMSETNKDFLHTKPWIPDGGILIFMAVIH